MTIRKITRPDGKTFCFGRKLPPEDRIPHLKFKNYLDANALPIPPTSCDYSIGSKVPLDDILMNDSLGCCVVSAIEHAFGVWESDAADNNTPSNTALLMYTNNQTVSLYSGACGYQPGNSRSDQGCDIQTTIKYVEKNGAPIGSNNKILGFLSVDSSNTVEQQLAIYLFENILFGICMPDSWVSPMPQSNGFVWDVSGNIDQNNGHCFLGIGYDVNGIEISTWGMQGTITYPAVSKYAASNSYGELYVMISESQLNHASQLAPNGLDINALVADFNTLGGNVVIANTTPTPQPNTTPTPVSNSVAGSAQWLHDNLASKDYQNLVNVYKAIEHHNPEVHLVSSAGWLKAHLSANAYQELYNSITTL